MSSQGRTELDIGHLFPEILPEVIPGSEFSIITQNPGNPVMVIPPINPGHSPLIRHIINQQMPVRHTTLLELHASDPDRVYVVQVSAKGIVPCYKGIVGGFPANLSPVGEPRIRGIPEGKGSIPFPVSHAIDPMSEGLTSFLCRVSIE